MSAFARVPLAALAVATTTTATASPAPPAPGATTSASGLLRIDRRASASLDPARVECEEGRGGAYPVPTQLRLSIGAGSSALRGTKPDIHLNVTEVVHQSLGARCADYKGFLAKKDVPATLAQTISEELGRNPAGECLRAFHESTTITAEGVTFKGNARFVVRPAEGCPPAGSKPAR